MREYKIDLHIHTNVNPHAFSTFEENVQAAVKKKMDIIAITNHGPALQDTPHWWHLVNITSLPDVIDGVRVIKGVEANIIDDRGHLDINQIVFKKTELILAGLHTIKEYGITNDMKKNTRAILNLIKKQKADIIVHLGNPTFPIVYEQIVKQAKKSCVALELNNTSLGNVTRIGSKANCKRMLELAKKEGCFISLGSDAHYSGNIGDFKKSIELLDEIDYPEELIINSSQEQFYKFLEKRKELKTDDVKS